MNTQQLLQHCLLAASLAGAAVCLAAVLAYHFRNQLRKLHERWLGLGPLGRFATLGLATVFVVYGSTKSPTNDPPDTVGGDTTNPPPMMCSSPRPRLSAPPEQPTTDNQQRTTLTAWHKRGAFSDWQRIDFPDGFAFPHGTNLLASITLFAWGEIRESLHQLTTNNQQLTTLPTAVSLEPNVSTVTYGLTASNSFLIAWENACVDRDATNRIDASIELFRNGDICVITQPLATNNHQPPTTNYYPAPLPEGFVGEGQDDAWVLAAFPDAYESITNLGYDVWLNDYVGYNEPNGRYKLSVTIDQQPTTNNQQPIYLVCGPYKMVVTHAGTYSFPLMDFAEYEVCTYPTPLPLSFEYDDGWDSPPSDATLLMAGTPRRQLASSNEPAYPYRVERFPEVYVHPNYVTREQALQELIHIRCNAAGIAARDYTSASGRAHLIFIDHSTARIEEAELQDTIYFSYECNGKSVEGSLNIGQEWWWYWWSDPTNDWSNVTNGTDRSDMPTP